jgi:hypothetical protein
MHGFPTISIIFGVIFALAGLALAVLLGLFLYPEKKRKTDSGNESLKICGEAENP